MTAASLAFLALTAPLAGALWAQGLAALDAFQAAALAARTERGLHALALEEEGAALSLPARFFHGAVLEPAPAGLRVRLARTGKAARAWTARAPPGLAVSGLPARLQGAGRVVLTRRQGRVLVRVQTAPPS